MIVKICGITDNAAALLAQALGATCVGAVLAPASKRFVPPERLPELFNGVTVRRAGVFVNADLEFIRRAVELGNLDVVQLHGDEPPGFAEKIDFAEVWKAFPCTAGTDVEKLLRYPAEHLLADAERGGSGASANWAVARRIAARRSLILAGGIGADNLSEALRLVAPAGVDVNSKLEASPGAKDAKKMREFFNVLKDIKL